MASITFAVDEELKPKIGKFSWVNWSEIAREELLRKEKIELLRNRLNSKEEQELMEWSVALGRKSKKERYDELKRKGLI